MGIERYPRLEKAFKEGRVVGKGLPSGPRKLRYASWLEAMDEQVECWHRDGEDKTIYEYLGMDWDQYKLFVENPKRYFDEMQNE